MQYRTQAEWVMPESAKLRTSEKEERLKEYRLQMACTMLKTPLRRLRQFPRTAGFTLPAISAKFFAVRWDVRRMNLRIRSEPETFD